MKFPQNTYSENFRWRPTPHPKRSPEVSEGTGAHRQGHRRCPRVGPRILEKERTPGRSVPRLGLDGNSDSVIALGKMHIKCPGIFPLFDSEINLAHAIVCKRSVSPRRMLSLTVLGRTRAERTCYFFSGLRHVPHSPSGAPYFKYRFVYTLKCKVNIQKH